MKSADKQIQIKVDELLAALETDCALFEKSFDRLQTLRKCLIERDENSMKNVLETVKEEAGQKAANEMRRETLRDQLSEMLECDVKQMTIGVLGNYLSDRQRERLFEKRARLIKLTDRLKKEHMRTNMLLAEYSRLNRAFLERIFYPKKPNRAGVYDSKGSVEKKIDAAFVNLKL